MLNVKVITFYKPARHSKIHLTIESKDTGWFRSSMSSDILFLLLHGHLPKFEFLMPHDQMQEGNKWLTFIILN